MNAVDTNVLVYALDADEPEKQRKAAELLDELIKTPAETVLLWQVASEFLSCLRKWAYGGRIAAADVEANFVNVLDMFPISLPTRGVFTACFALSSRFSLSHWDSMLLSACIEAGVDTLYTEDLDANTTYDSVYLINPFL
jgi:predicted nucleic acid-binding protein